MSKAPKTFDPELPLNGCEETAQYLGLSRGLVYAQAREGTLPAVRLGSRLLIKTQPLLAMLAEPAEPDPTGLSAACEGGCHGADGST